MRLAIDARELVGRRTGVGRYLACMLDAWRTLPAAAHHEFILCAPAPVETPLVDAGRATVALARGAGTIWEQMTLPRLAARAGADVLFAPGYSGPLLSTIPLVVAIHDVSFAAHPDWFPRREGLRRRVTTRLAAARAARVLTISQFSKQEIVRLLGVSPAKIHVVYPGIASMTEVAPGPVPPPAATILFAGSIFARRHVPELIEGFARLARRRPDVTLEIVGDNRTSPPIDLPRLASASGMGDRIRLRSFVSDSELATHYRSAAAFVFLSDYEGFGLTPLEALASGVPIAVLDTPVAREVYGEAAYYVSRPDPPLVEEALDTLVTNDAERARILAAARALLPRYSWHACAEQVLQVLVEVSRCRG